MISANSAKPIVKLLINRHNNKYSYTGASDDNILKNIELFDKLSLRFSNRVLFIKNVIGSNEICCWSFYGHGKKIAEVCCTAIVYATDRKNTKVEFPEARIYEETLNCLLYENRNGPDQELMYLTSSKPVTPVRPSSHVVFQAGSFFDARVFSFPRTTTGGGLRTMKRSVAEKDIRVDNRYYTSHLQIQIIVTKLTRFILERL